jgi:hypothetical protein
MLPDISDFTLLGSELKQGQDCQKWQKKEVIGQKVSKPLPDWSEFEQTTFWLVKIGSKFFVAANWPFSC